MDKITPEELRELLGSAPNENYIFEGDNMTFIKEQNITVDKCENFYAGSKPKPTKKQEVATEPNHEGAKKTKTSIDRVITGVCAVYDSGIIKYDYEYSAIFKAIEEKKVFDQFSFSELVELLKDSGKFNDGKLPTSSNISKIVIKGIFPEWKVADKGYSVTKQIVKIGECFFSAFNKD